MHFSPAIDCMSGERNRITEYHRHYCTYGVDLPDLFHEDHAIPRHIDVDWVEAVRPAGTVESLLAKTHIPKHVRVNPQHSPVEMK